MNKREYIEELKAALHAVRQERINRVRSRIHRLRVTTPAPGDIRDIMRLIQGAEALRRLIEDTKIDLEDGTEIHPEDAHEALFAAGEDA